MPANEEVWRSPKTMHGVFAVSSFALLAATLWMMKADYADEWRPIQRTNFKLKERQLDADIAALSTAEFESRLKELEAAHTSADAALAEQKEKVKAARDTVNGLDGRFQLLTRQVKFKRAERDVARANLDLKVRDGLLGAALKPWQQAFDKEQKSVDDMELQLQKLQAEFDAARSSLAEITRDHDKAVAELKKHRAELDRLQTARDRIAPSGGALFKRKLMEVPIIEGFNGHLKPNQIWLPDLTVTLGMKATARFDRCITCHVNIDAVGEGNKPMFPFDPHGITMDNAAEYLEGSKSSGYGSKKPSWKRDDGTIVYGHPFATHPHPELYLTDKSPHPMQKFGCTGCHEGQGSGTSFHNASHSPDSPDVGEKWREKYGYFYNHFWEYPMFPKRLEESACLKCHHNVVELGVNPKFGTSAPRLYQGYQLILQYGCFGCHEVNGYNTGIPIGPDIRLEPQTQEEADRIAADPTAVAGTQRKVGPGLRHFAAKTNPGWAEMWVKEPKAFRPDTRMPQFFGLTNQKDPHAKELQPVEIAGIVKFLFDKSEEFKLDQWASGYKPDAKRGQVFFSQRGCLACHSHKDFPGITSEFGPDLTNVHKKITSIEWLYTWVRDPTRHSARTRMPNLFLEPEGAGEKYVDPAADIAAYLLSNRDDVGKLVTDGDGNPVRDDTGPARYETTPADPAAVESLMRLFLSKVLTKENVDKTLSEGRYPEADAARIKAAAIQPDEIELVEGPITDDVKLRYIGRRSISRYGCYGCHDIPGFEKARPIGTSLQDWGRKDPTKLALEHIEEFLHHHGEPDGSSTIKRVEEAIENGRNDNFRTPEEKDRETAAAYFVDQLNHHGRAGFLWQKLRDPRSYDYKKIETKGYDERLRMPKFPFNESEIEAIATFVLGLVAEPPAEKYLYRPQGAAKARIEGETLLQKYNCVGCHIIDLPEIYGAPSDMSPDELTAADHKEAFDLLLKLKPPRNAKTDRTLKTGEPVFGFRGLLLQPPDVEADPDDQFWYYQLWETLDVGEQGSYRLPGTRPIEIPAKNLQEVKPARGGAFSEWLVEHSMKMDREVKRDFAWHMAPPPLYKEGIKVQTPWLYSFLKDPTQIRYTTVLRMPRFTLSNEEAEKLANYFAAYDGAPYPYQEVQAREPDYLAAKHAEHPNYLRDSWKLITYPPPAGLCQGCHAVGGREFAGGGDPTKVTHGPNLEGVYNRLSPDWLQLWIYHPTWITPYTRMPQNLPADKQVFPELFGGESRIQNVAARDALMNYLRLLEKEGRAVTTAPAAPPAAAPGGQK